MTSPNLHASVNELKLATEAVKTKEILPKKPQKRNKREDVVRKPPQKRKSLPSKSDGPKMPVTREQRATEGIVSKSRKSDIPLNKRLKDVISYLLEKRRDMTKAEICETENIDLDDAELWEAVTHNQKIEVLENGKFRYRPRHHRVVDKEQLLMHIRRNPKGTQYSDISDTYEKVGADVEALVKDKKIFVIEHPDIEDRVIFWKDPMIETVKLSGQIMDLWREARPPSPGDENTFDELLRKSGIQKAARKEPRKRGFNRKSPKKRKPKYFKIRKITNEHLPELFKSSQPDQIDD